VTGSGLRAAIVDDAGRWNAFVEGARYHAFPQLWEWGQLREAAGWRPLRLGVTTSGGDLRAGVQLLLRAIPILGWHLAYAPRGPIGDLDDGDVRDALLGALRIL
jgi:peptidoglycan pentaglycine glycine transferase (the first glycine)